MSVKTLTYIVVESASHSIGLRKAAGQSHPSGRAGGWWDISNARAIAPEARRQRDDLVVEPQGHTVRTCGFPASGFQTGFMTGSRHGALPPQVSQPRHAKIAEHRVLAERPDAARRHLVTPDEEVTHAVIQMGLDHAIRNVAGSRTEVAAPSSQEAVQCTAYLRPWPFVARYQDRSRPGLKTLQVLIRRRCPGEPPALLPVARRAEAATQKVKRLRLASHSRVFVRFRLSPRRVITPSVHVSASALFPPPCASRHLPRSFRPASASSVISGTVSGERVRAEASHKCDYPAAFRLTAGAKYFNELLS